jgi:hypothetical protein
VLHSLSWYAFSLFSQGDWDRILTEILPIALEQLGDRRDDPPYFTGHLVGSTAFILDARGDPGAAEARARLERQASGVSPLPRCWWGWLLVRRGDAA